MQYRVVPFVADFEADHKIGPAANAAAQLQETINAYAEKGWEFVRLEQVSYVSRSGCLLAFTGGKPTAGVAEVIVFRAGA